MIVFLDKVESSSNRYELTLDHFQIANGNPLRHYLHRIIIVTQRDCESQGERRVGGWNVVSEGLPHTNCTYLGRGLQPCGTDWWSTDLCWRRTQPQTCSVSEGPHSPPARRSQVLAGGRTLGEAWQGPRYTGSASSWKINNQINQNSKSHEKVNKL